MSRRRIAIACQGGGSQCAFVAGALDALFARDIEDRYEIVGLSGTSGGAITAAAAWQAMLKRAHGDRTPVGDPIKALWEDLSAQTPLENVLDKVCIDTVRLIEHGALPSVATSPTSLPVQLWTKAMATMIARPEFTDLRALLLKHIDFDALPGLVRPDSPVLEVSAGDVLKGNFRVFTSARNEIKVEALLASAAIPTLFPAVWVDGHAYWDGIFASNPPIISLLQKTYMGNYRRPQEIWIIQFNRAEHETVPETPSEISDRRNHLAGNLSLQHELQMIDLWNLLLQRGALTDEFRARLGIDVTEPIAVHFIRMSKELQDSLDYPSKLSREPAHIERLMADGTAQALAFLARIEAPGGAAQSETVVEHVEPSSSMWAT
jgi:NTE family protein